MANTTITAPRHRFVRRRWNTAALALGVLCLAGCESVVDPGPATPAATSAHSAASRPAPPTPPKFVARTPLYPAPVIYILYREYLHKNPGLTTLSPEDKHYQQYVERRLRQLYPTKGYSGMMQDAVEEMRQYRLAWKAYEQEYDIWIQAFCRDLDGGVGDCDSAGTAPPDDGTGSNSDPMVDPSWDGQEEHPVPPDEIIPTLQMEIDTLQMSQLEVDQLYYQESLADGSFFISRHEQIVTSTGDKATIDDLIRAAGDGWTPPGTGPAKGEVVVQVIPAIIAAVVVTGAVIGWKAYRVKQAAERANEKSTEYFGSLNSASTKRDAHRHIFWNMQMRRYVGSALAKWIADDHEEQGNTTAADQAMDYHNNDIGREVKYESFRGRWLGDRWDWKEWAEKVRDYVNTPANQEYIPEWRTNPPSTLQEANARAALAPNWKYIYFAP